jgi:hypothetical protein
MKGWVKVMENERMLDRSKRFELDAMDTRENLNDYEEKIKAFQIELTKLINNHSLENITNTPDFILSCLRSYHTLHFNKDIWYCKDEKQIKKCVMCDKVLVDQNYNYISNHYLCGSECTDSYIKMSVWNDKLGVFIPDINCLNHYRKIHNDKPISKTQLEKYIDGPLKDVEK